jgi:hypothetical protein
MLRSSPHGVRPLTSRSKRTRFGICVQCTFVTLTYVQSTDPSELCSSLQHNTKTPVKSPIEGILRMGAFGYRTDSHACMIVSVLQLRGTLLSSAEPTNRSWLTSSGDRGIFRPAPTKRACTSTSNQDIRRRRSLHLSSQMRLLRWHTNKRIEDPSTDLDTVISIIIPVTGNQASVIDTNRAFLPLALHPERRPSVARFSL